MGTQTFIRVEEELTWYEAREHCRIYHTDLANMESLKGLRSMLDLYSLLKDNPAWIGLFFDVETGTLSWSSGPIFTTPFWFMNLSEFTDGFCALVKMALLNLTPNVKAALCSTHHAFICYYDPAIGHLITRESSLSGPTIPLTPAEVRIGEKIFTRITTEEKTWSAALQYCQTHYTSLADLQSVTEGTPLNRVSSEIGAWIGLYFDGNSQSLRWSSNFGSSIPSWLSVPMFGEGQCATLRRFVNYFPRVSSAFCSELKPFICVYGPPGSFEVHTESPLGSSSLSPRSHKLSVLGSGNSTTSNYTTITGWELSTSKPLFTPSGNSTTSNYTTITGRELSTSKPLFTPSGNSITSNYTTTTGRELSTSKPLFTPSGNSITSNYTTTTGRELSTSKALFTPSGNSITSNYTTTTGRELSTSKALFTPSGNSITSNYTTTTGRELSTTTAARPELPGSPSGPKAVTSQASGSGISPITTGMPVPSLAITARPTTRLGPSQSQPEPAPGSSSVFGETVGGTSQGLLASSDFPRISLFLREGNSTTSDCTTTTTTGASPEPPRSPSGPKAVTSQASGPETSLITPGTPGPALTSTARPTPRLGPSQSQPEPAPEQSFGILKADFNSRAVLESEDRKEEFLREIQEVVKIILGHEQFRLKWISFEENQN
ncbi:putative C-type lectin domain family 20 member A [Sminthopsis crassicaudata]|uniref:putative C-type lectin domain family 20 member A n=1 Tax=Sminthopsis crassicaudata TaxID=9301 RepID=UPI003D692EF2